MKKQILANQLVIMRTLMGTLPSNSTIEKVMAAEIKATEKLLKESK